MRKIIFLIALLIFLSTGLVSATDVYCCCIFPNDAAFPEQLGEDTVCDIGTRILYEDVDDDFFNERGEGGFCLSACWADCGDDEVDWGEACDGINLDGETCQSFGYAGGTLTCDDNCVFDFSACTNPPDTEIEVQGGCSDGLNNDEDDFTDCDDSDCAPHLDCGGQGFECTENDPPRRCADVDPNIGPYGVCEDIYVTCTNNEWPECTIALYEIETFSAYEVTESLCEDVLDNDCDGYIDMEDADCEEAIICNEGECWTNENRICTEEEEWSNPYNLDDPLQRDIYCGTCPLDNECNVLVCPADPAERTCDNYCPDGCQGLNQDADDYDPDCTPCNVQNGCCSNLLCAPQDIIDPDCELPEGTCGNAEIELNEFGYQEECEYNSYFDELGNLVINYLSTDIEGVLCTGEPTENIPERCNPSTCLCVDMDCESLFSAGMADCWQGNDDACQPDGTCNLNSCMCESEESCFDGFAIALQEIVEIDDAAEIDLLFSSDCIEHVDNIEIHGGFVAAEELEMYCPAEGDLAQIFTNFGEIEGHGVTGSIFRHELDIDEDNIGYRNEQREYLCYVAKATIGDQEAYTIGHHLVGHPECMREHDAEPFCYGSAIVSCQQEPQWRHHFADEVACNEGEICRIINNEATCTSNTVCDVCGGAFGMFASVLDMTVWYEGREVSCADVVAGDDGGCYLDHSLTTVNRLYPLLEDISCYDFHSERTCVNWNDEDANAGGLEFNNGENPCEWIPFEREESTIELGVCRPKSKSDYPDIPYDQHCEYAHSPRYNYVTVPGSLTTEVCGMFGECYFNRIENYNRDFDKMGMCINKEDMFCENYDTQIDCTLSGGGDNSFFDIDVEYEGEEYGETRIGNTHYEYSLGKDLFGFGKCRWWNNLNDGEPGQCFRDADENILDMNAEESPVRLSSRMDCGAYPDSEPQCSRDFISPVTEITYTSSSDAPPRGGYEAILDPLYGEDEDPEDYEDTELEVGFGGDCTSGDMRCGIGLECNGIPCIMLCVDAVWVWSVSCDDTCLNGECVTGNEENEDVGNFNEGNNEGEGEGEGNGEGNIGGFAAFQGDQQGQGDDEPPEYEGYPYAWPIFGPLITAEFAITDDQYIGNEMNELITYFCVETYNENGEYCYPSAELTEQPINLKNVDNEEIQQLITDEQSGYYSMYFYSVDSAQNLEQLKMFNFMLDAEKPRILLNVETNAHDHGGDIGYRTELRLQWNVVDETWNAPEYPQPVKCTTALINGITGEEMYPELSHAGTVYASSFETTYPFLEDGTYFFRIMCEDEYGNRAENRAYDEYLINSATIEPEYNDEIDMEVFTLDIEGDISITNPNPHYETFNNEEPITISIETQFQGECRYSREHQEWEAMLDGDPLVGGMFLFDTDGVPERGQFVYTRSLNIPDDVPRDVYLYYTACRFEIPGPGGDEILITEGNNGDIVVFFIDEMAPYTSIWEGAEAGSEPFDFETWHRSPVDLFVRCTDMPTHLNWPTEDDSRVFGCQDTLRCEGGALSQCDDENDFTSMVGEDPQPYLWTVTGLGEQQLPIRYYSIDEGGNKEEIRTQNIKLDSNIVTLTVQEPVNHAGDAVDHLGFGTYTLQIDASKELGDIYLFNMLLDAPVGTISIPVDWIYLENNMGIQGIFTIRSDIPELNGLEERDLFVQLEGEDYHEFRFDEFDDQFTYPISYPFKVTTMNPEPPVFNPSLNLYGSGIFEEYPLHYYDEKYYTNDPELYFSGYTVQNIFQTVKFYTVQDENVEEYAEPKLVYTQSEYNAEDFTSVIQPVVVDSVNDNQLVIQQCLSDSWNAGYLSFTNGAEYESNHNYQYINDRKDYGYFAKFYEIIDISRTEGCPDGEGVTTITIDPAKENVEGETIYKMWDEDRPKDYFSSVAENPLEFVHTEINRDFKFFAAVEDNIGNRGRTEYYNIYVDDEIPMKTQATFPGENIVTNKNNSNITLVVNERYSGLLEEGNNIWMQLTSGETSIPGIFSVGHEGDLYYLQFQPEGAMEFLVNHFNDDGSQEVVLADAVYNVTAFAMDRAHNEFNYAWSFEINSMAPNNPFLTIRDAPAINPEPRSQVYLTANNEPVLILDFNETGSINLTEVNLNGGIYDQESIVMERCIATDDPDAEAPGVQQGVTAVTGSRWFICSLPELTEGIEYVLDVAATRILNSGEEVGPSLTFFTVVVDTTPPDAVIDTYATYMNEEGVFYLTYTVTNEEYGLFMTIDAEDDDLLTVQNFGEEQMFIIREGMDWTGDRTKTLTVVFSDYAGNEGEAQNIDVIVDNTIPVFDIVHYTAAPRVVILNDTPTTRGSELTLEGTTHDDIFRISAFDISIDPRVLRNQASRSCPTMRNCIIDGFANITVSLESQANQEILNMIAIVVQDYAGNTREYPLDVLLDLVPPEEPFITLID